jgi:hypothetical protein
MILQLGRLRPVYYDALGSHSGIFSTGKAKIAQKSASLIQKQSEGVLGLLAMTSRRFRNASRHTIMGLRQERVVVMRGSLILSNEADAHGL